MDDIEQLSLRNFLQKEEHTFRNDFKQDCISADQDSRIALVRPLTSFLSQHYHRKQNREIDVDVAYFMYDFEDKFVSWGFEQVFLPMGALCSYTSTRLRDLLPRYSSCTPPESRTLLSSDVVYKYTCSCGQVYIGETKRRLAVRISEHSKPETPLM